MSAFFQPWLFAPLFLLGFPILIYGFSRADRLVRAERESHPQEWERDGFPAGFFGWVGLLFSADPTIFRARTPVPWRWKFRTPPWIAASPEYRRWLRHYRVCIAIWNMLGIAIFSLMLFSLLHRDV